jgi:OOP family OmpA-OmpF porin
LIWKGVDIAANTPYVVEAGNGGQTDFSATELFLTGQAGFLIKPFERLFLNFDFRADYLTGAGQDFATEVTDNLDKLVLSAGFRLSFGFGSSSGAAPTRWRSDSLWQTQPAQPVTRRAVARDGDGDGVDDDKDACLGTPAGALVGPNGCSLDSDNDGVPDGLDDCPGTPQSAAGKVDLFGCPVDSDFDGVPDYADNCPTNAVGAIVNEQGCPIDTDGDGIPDGLDDCPGTMTGLSVDLHGCVDLSGFAQPMVLNIDYPPGGFEIDPNSRERLKKLATTLNFVKELKLEIYGYTDNIGTTQANQQMSEKRARRVKDFLVANGVDPDRIRFEGKGETNFVASNQTADGRAKNRRIEIIFYR